MLALLILLLRLPRGAAVGQGGTRVERTRRMASMPQVPSCACPRSTRAGTDEMKSPRAVEKSTFSALR